MLEKLWHLKRCELFRQLTPAEVQRAESRSRVRTFAARSPIYLPEERADSVFLIVEGVVKVSSLSPDGKQSILAFLRQERYLGNWPWSTPRGETSLSKPSSEPR